VSDPTLPEGTLLRIEMEVRLPCAATIKQIDDWLEFDVANRGGIDLLNPLAHEDAAAWSFDWSYTDYIVREERTLKEERPDGTKVYSVRRIREKIVDLKP
jgi:hypothetical protein